MVPLSYVVYRIFFFVIMKHLNITHPNGIDNTNPKYLFHGSSFHHEELMPGYYRSKELVEWDDGESNLFLYATSSRQEAISLGFASSIEHKHTLDKISLDENVIDILTSNTSFSLEDLHKLEVYVYTIVFNDSDKWIKNNNDVNNIKTEWKTDKTKIKYLTVEKINIPNWLKDKKITIKHK